MNIIFNKIAFTNNLIIFDPCQSKVKMCRQLKSKEQQLNLFFNSSTLNWNISLSLECSFWLLWHHNLNPIKTHLCILLNNLPGVCLTSKSIMDISQQKHACSYTVYRKYTYYLPCGLGCLAHKSTWNFACERHTY